ncbi:MAG: hypothetical protein ACREQW_15285 [Candidatus Binatia bacterium]
MAGSRTRRWAIAGILLVFMTLSAAMLFKSHMRKTADGGGGPSVHLSPGTLTFDRRDARADLPPVGRSLFDFLFTEKEGGRKAYRVPFPFVALLSKIESRLARDETRPSALRRVLIPLGRSLQRDAGAPEFFRYPRALVAIDGVPRTGSGAAGILLKDRLYLGYHEKAAIIEVISYNEAAGRFEFQVVTDYKPGGKPQVFYASRALCTSCHHNHAPVFSRPSWAETNANPRIAARLREQPSRFYGFPVDQSIDEANAFDDATDRANLYALTQRLWREGCAAGADKSVAIQCRADAFLFVLQYVLSGGRHFDVNSSRYTKEFLPVIGKSWKEKWPAGIPVPNPDLPNRNPLIEVAVSSEYPAVPEEFRGQQRLTPADLVRFADVSPAFDPLMPRPPLEPWRFAEHGIGRFIDGLAQFLAPEDIRRMDAHLFAAGLKSQRRAIFKAACSLTQESREASTELMKFRCGEPDPARRSAAGLFISGRLDISPGGSFSGTIEDLSLQGSGELRNLAVSSGAYERDGAEGAIRLSVVQESSGLHARRADGNAIESVRLSAPQFARSLRAPSRGEFSGTASVSVLEDFAPAAEAIGAIARATEKDEHDAFSAKPFRRAVVMKALSERLGIEIRDWCCVDDTNMPPPQAETPILSQGHPESASAKGAPAPLDIFYRKCAVCHGLSSPAPPNFMRGNLSQVKSKIEQCAERIYYRLDMWRLEPQQRPKTPMPPVSDFHKMGLAQQVNITPAEVAAMKEYVKGSLSSASEPASRWRELAGRNYVDLSTCLSHANESQMAGAVTRAQ